jgi:prepilin-type N-terminal cleavage/methylation domain-containing protein
MKNHLRAGFSLLEVAIVLIIMGVVIGAAMPSILQFRQQARLKETKERQELVVHAVAAYAVMNGRLPCPSDPEVSRGKMRKDCHTAETAMGIVPYGSLGLSEAQAKDGFHRFMTYAVPVDSWSGPNRARDSNVCKLKPYPCLTLKYNDEVLYGENMTEVNDFVAMVLVSHGPGGQGAYTGVGENRLAIDGASDMERVNGDDKLTFQDAPYNLHEDKPFRHIVKWVTRNNLMAYYGRHPCTKEISASYDVDDSVSGNVSGKKPAGKPGQNQVPAKKNESVDPLGKK